MAGSTMISITIFTQLKLSDMVLEFLRAGGIIQVFHSVRI